MSTAREHAARLREAADWIDAKETRIAALTTRAEDAREERNEQRIRAVAAEYDRDAFREQLDKIVSALGKAPSNRADLPRLVRELRDERDRLRAESNGMGIAAEKWRKSAKEAEDELADLKARAVALPENAVEKAAEAIATPRYWNWDDCCPDHPPELGTTFYDLARAALSAVRGPEPASREPEAAGFKIGERVWDAQRQEAHTVISIPHPVHSHLVTISDDVYAGRDVEPDRLRHVYTADSPPPEGVNVVRDSHGKLWTRHESFWRKKNALVSCRWSTLVKARGPELVEHREGDR